MTILELTGNNIKEEHICCAISDKKCREGYTAKKEWLRKQFKDNYKFKKIEIKGGKAFIEYVSVENCWIPIEAPGYILVNCFWVSGQFKGKGYGRQLFQECVNDANDKNGIVIVTGTKKQAYMSDKNFFIKQGFMLCDTSEPYFELWYKPNKENIPIPKFKEIAKKGICDISDGLSVYYTNACPFTEYYTNTELVQIAKEKGIKLTIHKLETKEKAQNHFVPHTIYSIFYNGKFITQHILTKTNFDKFIKL